MSDKPILFSAPMIRALLDGAKTQTRRDLKPPYGTLEFQSDGTWKPICTKFFPGDRLWVKEGWRDEHPVAIQEGRYSQAGRAGIPGPPGVRYRTIYRADGEPLQAWRQGGYPYFNTDGPASCIDARYPTVCSTFDRRDGKGVLWGNARFMPRWASRLTLIVTDVRVQRLQDISDADAWAEGCRGYVSPCGDYGETPREEFHGLWNSLHGPDAWDANPWVVALTLDVYRSNIDQMGDPA